MFSRALNKAPVFFTGFLLFLTALISTEIPYSYAQTDTRTSPEDRQLQQAPSPVKTDYEDFLSELGIGTDRNVPEQILDKDFQVTLRLLNRHMSETTDITLQAQGSRIFDELLLSVSACIPEHDDIPGNDAAFVTIRGKDGSVLFHGWMMKLYPSAAVFEHPVYDVMVRGCEDLSD